jgi:acyl-coenzyme A thioesterase PaaI-like protein
MTESADISYFKSIPWCSSLLSDQNYAITPTRSREPKETTEDALFAETLQTKTTISACLSLYKKAASADELIQEARRLLSLGSGLNGWPHVCHGGITATILDEVMGHLLTINVERQEELAKAAGEVPSARPAAYTAELSVKFLKPVETPQVVCVVARIVKSGERKIWLEGVVEDRFGRPLATGTCVYVQLRAPKL